MSPSDAVRRPPTALSQMLVAVLSDIHANRHAFEAVLASARKCAVDEIWCLGDIVGYGAEPDDCVALAAAARRPLPVRQPRPRGHR